MIGWLAVAWAADPGVQVVRGADHWTIVLVSAEGSRSIEVPVPRSEAEHAALVALIESLSTDLVLPPPAIPAFTPPEPAAAPVPVPAAVPAPVPVSALAVPVPVVPAPVVPSPPERVVAPPRPVPTVVAPAPRVVVPPRPSPSPEGTPDRAPEGTSDGTPEGTPDAPPTAPAPSPSPTGSAPVPAPASVDDPAAVAEPVPSAPPGEGGAESRPRPDAHPAVAEAPRDPRSDRDLPPAAALPPPRRPVPPVRSRPVRTLGPSDLEPGGSVADAARVWVSAGVAAQPAFTVAPSFGVGGELSLGGAWLGASARGVPLRPADLAPETRVGELGAELTACGSVRWLSPCAAAGAVRRGFEQDGAPAGAVWMPRAGLGLYAGGFRLDPLGMTAGLRLDRDLGVTWVDVLPGARDRMSGWSGSAELRVWLDPESR